MKGTTGRERMLPPFVLGLASVVLGSLVAASAPAAPPPDAAALDRLRAAAAAHNPYRIVTARAQFVIGSVIGTAIGFGLMKAVEPNATEPDIAIVLVPLGAVVGGGLALARRHDEWMARGVAMSRALSRFVAVLCGAAPLASVGAALFGAALLAPVAALADPTPDAVLRERLEAGRWNRFRLVTTRSTFEISSLDFDSIGVRLAAPPRRPAIVTSPDADPGRPRYVRWSEIEHVDAARRKAGKGALEGAIVGGIVGVSTAFLIGVNVHDESALAAVGAVPLGVVFGALTGAGFWGGGKWARIYP